VKIRKIAAEKNEVVVWKKRIISFNSFIWKLVYSSQFGGKAITENDVLV